MRNNAEHIKLQKIKLLKIWEILNRKTDKDHPMTTIQLISELAELGIDAERRTIYTDIDAMIAYGYKIDKQRHNRDMYYWVEQRQFDIPELKILMDAVQSSKFIPEDKSEELLDKIANLGGSERGKLLRRNAVKFQVVKHSNEEIYSTVERIEQAISKRYKITFVYFDLNRLGERVYRHDRKVYSEQPISMICDDGNYYLMCYTDDEDCDSNIKVFRLDRMSEVELSEDSITEEAIQAVNNVKSYPKQVFKMYGGEPCKIRLEFDKTLTGVIFNKFGENIKIRTSGDKYSTLVNVQLSPTFWGWLSQFPGKMVLVSPEKVIDEYKTWLKAALGSYEK